MRYLHVLDSLARGGVETTCLHMLRVFRASPAADGTADVHDVLAFNTGSLHRAFLASAHRVIVSSLPVDLAAVLANAYDVVHVLTARAAHRLAPMALAGSDAALVYSRQYDGPALARLEGAFDHAADESLLSACDAVTFTTLDLAAGYRLPPGRATILRKAAEIAQLLDLPPVAPDVPPRILTIANVAPLERLGDLLPVMAAVRRRVPDAELRLVGGGPPARMTALRDAIADAGLDGVVTLAGPQVEIAPELAAARVLALPTAAEGVPTVVVEAMAAARPVVATRVGHIGHVLTDGREGFLTTPGDLHGFAARLVTLLEQPALAARMGAAGRARAAAHDVRAVAGDVLRILRRAAAARRRAAA